MAPAMRHRLVALYLVQRSGADPQGREYARIFDALRASGAVLAAQTLDLEPVNRDLDRLGSELRMEETQRHRLAADIHDELGENLTAVHTRILLAANRLDAAQLGLACGSL
jgi:signal transduction histidine kinase